MTTESTRLLPALSDGVSAATSLMNDASTDTIDRTDTTVNLKVDEPGDHERFSHYVRKEAILAATIDGIPAIALCGKKWVPNRDGQKFPVCPECKDIYENVVGSNLPGGGK